MEQQPRRITSNDLPITLRDIKAARHARYQENAGKTLLVIGGIVLFVGVLILLFGPSSLRVSLAGPTFTEFLLLNPGPIASIGLFLVIAGSQTSTHALDRVDKYVQKNYVLHDKYGKPATDGIIVAEPQHNDDLILHYVSLEDIKPPEEAAAPRNTGQAS